MTKEGIRGHAWRNAEEMAQISDNLLVPEEVEDKMAGLKEQ